MTSPNGRTRHRADLPPKIEEAFKTSETRRDGARTSRLDYASGYEDGYRDALEEMQRTAKRLSKELLKP